MQRKTDFILQAVRSLPRHWSKSEYKSIHVLKNHTGGSVVDQQRRQWVAVSYLSVVLIFPPEIK